MALQAGIVGLPNVGKSTLFNCLSNAKAQSANFPFCTIEPNVGTINVPDQRLNAIAAIDKPQRVVPNTLKIHDIAGLVKGASEGEGLGNQFLANIRETDAIIHVLRCFDDDNVAHVDGSVDPLRDKEVVEAELQLKDLETVEKRLDKIEKQAQTGDKAARRYADLLKRLKETLEAGKGAREIDYEEEEANFLKDLQLLTNKPVLYACNVDEASLRNGNAYSEALKENIAGEAAEMLIIAAQTEADIAELETPEERAMFLEEMGLEEPGVNKLIKTTYKLLDLETFFTTGPKETRAWAVKRGTRALEAAGMIHSDFARGFIRAEVFKFEDYQYYGSEQACKEAGKMAVEGKDYVVQDGDVIHFRFNV